MRPGVNCSNEEAITKCHSSHRPEPRSSLLLHASMVTTTGRTRRVFQRSGPTCRSRQSCFQLNDWSPVRGRKPLPRSLDDLIGHSYPNLKSAGEPLCYEHPGSMILSYARCPPLTCVCGLNPDTFENCEAVQVLVAPGSN